MRRSAAAMIRMTFAAAVLVAGAVLPAQSLAAAEAPAAPSAEGVRFFEEKVRPLLVEKCYQCHSAEAASRKKLKGGLLLDTRGGWQAGGDNGSAVIPGKPDESLLVKAVRWEHEDLQMPPKEKLPQAQVDALVQWVKRGAPDPRDGASTAGAATKPFDPEAARRELWSLQPLKQAPPPAVEDSTGWAKNDIDRYILAKLREKGISPNAPVDRRKLIRRMSFGVTGLPPTPQEIEAFVNDKSAGAVEELVDRLLASPRFGERWASHWLDVARFGESDGFEHDYDRPHAYHFRDFVIRAFNDDLPYDKFVKWQLAGDEYEPHNPLAMMATGFLTAGVFPTQITEKEFESTRYNQLDDMVATTSVAFLGLTVGCARCHDHKFDPIPALDYYRMTASFTSAVRSDIEIDLGTPAERAKAKEEFERRRGELQAAVTNFERDRLPGKFDAYVAELAKKGGDVTPAAWAVLEVDDIKTGGTRFTRLPDGSLLRVGETPARDTYTFTARTDATNITGLRLEALAHESLPKKGPGLAANGNFVLGAFEILAAPADSPGRPVELSVARARATHQQDAASLSVAATLDEDPVTGWAVGGGVGKDQAAVFEFDEPVGFPGGTVFTFRLRFEHPNGHHAIGRPRLSVTTASPVPQQIKGGGDGPPVHVARTLKRLAKSEVVDPADVEAARKWFAATLPDYRELRTALSTHEAKGPEKRAVKVQVTSEGLPPAKNHADERGYPHRYPQTHYLRRGDPAQKGEAVTPSFLRILMRGGKDERAWLTPPPPGSRTSHRRRALAEWMTDTEHGAGHLAARVIVNRLWQHHVGRGIVATPSDYGTRGTPPTHPELLDFLASELVRNGWRLKPIHKLILLSGTYATGSDYDAAKAKADPDNLLFWRRPVRRLESEAIRDAMLAAAGMLDTTMHGPGTLDPGSKRRSVYFKVKRSALIPMMVVFDAPEPLTPVSERPTTTIAPQALLLMNNPQVREYAKALAKRAGGDEGGKDVTRVVRAAYRIALGRDATEQEAIDSAAFIEGQAAAYRSAGQADARGSALADFCQTLMCLNEFVYVE